MNIDHLPRTTLPGATRDEVKLLAMGAARSKGWSVSETGPDRIVAKRTVDASLLSVLEGADPSTGIQVGSTLEVTSYFVEQGGGVDVAVKADLRPPVTVSGGSISVDYTPYYRDTLDRSLDSLRANWSRNRGRLARATPPADGWKDPWADTPYARPDKTSTETEVAVEGPSSEPDSATAEAATPSSNEPEATSPEPRVVDRPPEPREVDRPPEARPSSPESSRPEIAEAPMPARPSSLSRGYIRPLPEPRRSLPSAAPVVDATRVLSADPRPAAADRLSRGDNMMALPMDRTRGATSVTWAAYAEQYARQHGCQVSASGAELIESRRDGEVHKVPCEGSDSFLVKCQNGTCQGLL